ncbi:hypothetical protein [Glutamicibacter ardleyensis]|uniref:hypothetical protein n=1 Tax=Glutamicibacter ardleyensis TaxID=225894 RepID=UPI003FD548F5
MSTLFVPTPGQDYGFCRTCDKPMPTEEDKNQHWASPEGQGHTIHVANKPRLARIRDHIQQGVDDAMSSFYSEIDSQIARGDLTEEEAKNAMKSAFVDVADGWDDYSNE